MPVGRPQIYSSRRLFSANCNPETYQKFKETARRDGETVSELLERFMEDYLKTHGSENANSKVTYWVDNPDHKVCPAFLEKQDKWAKYIDDCGTSKELAEIEGKAYFILNNAKSRFKEKKREEMFGDGGGNKTK